MGHLKPANQEASVIRRLDPALFQMCPKPCQDLCRIALGTSAFLHALSGLAAPNRPRRCDLGDPWFQPATAQPDADRTPARQPPRLSHPLSEPKLDQAPSVCTPVVFHLASMQSITNSVQRRRPGVALTAGEPPRSQCRCGAGASFDDDRLGLAFVSGVIVQPSHCLFLQTLKRLAVGPGAP